MNKKYKIITHSDGYHADDVFACATLSILLDQENKEYEIIRSRDVDVINTGDYVVDVGRVYDVDTNRFDHHQKEGAGARANGIPYASFGLVWAKYGAQISRSEICANRIDQKLVTPIDAHDSGVDISKFIFDNVSDYSVGHVIQIFTPTWQEDWNDIDKAFIEAVALAKKIIEREIIITNSIIEAEKQITQAYEKSSDKRILILDKHFPATEILSSFREVLYIIRPRGEGGESWGVKSVRKDSTTFDNKKDLPKEWGGKDGEELAKVTGVHDAIFCHKALFLCSAKSKEGAIKLAQIAVNA
jgi:uncharacterized UPF0160 family protein